MLGYVGFETSAVYTEEARDPKRTVRLATYLSLGMIAIVYTAASWMLAVTYGQHHVASVAQQQGPGMLFGVGSALLGNIAQTLFLTSPFFSTLEWEVLSRHHFSTRNEAREIVMGWVCDFYNSRRRHSSCEMKSPIDYENSAIVEAA